MRAYIKKKTLFNQRGLAVAECRNPSAVLSRLLWKILIEVAVNSAGMKTIAVTAELLRKLGVKSEIDYFHVTQRAAFRRGELTTTTKCKRNSIIVFLTSN